MSSVTVRVRANARGHRGQMAPHAADDPAVAAQEQQQCTTSSSAGEPSLLLSMDDFKGFRQIGKGK